MILLTFIQEYLYYNPSDGATPSAGAKAILKKNQVLIYIDFLSVMHYDASTSRQHK